MGKNEFIAHRVAVATLANTGSTAAFTQNSGMFIPAGAIITGIRIVAANTAVTTTGASQTVAPRVGTANIGATLN
jgi:hypothetical protein